MKEFEIEIVDHCNLNCKSCDHFSSIAQEKFLSEETFNNDIERMSELFPDIEILTLTGGEPLLHPNINYFLETSRYYYPNAEIRLFTNCILLDKMSQEFWECCSSNNITIEYEYYPLNIDREKYLSLCEEYNVRIIRPDWVVNKEEFIKEQYRFPLNDKKNKDINKNYNKCFKTKCTTLKNGKIYMCTYCANISHFNNFFNKNLEITSEDYIDIYTHTSEEIDEFLIGAKPFCGYCNIDNISRYGEWDESNLIISEYKISEWLDEEEQTDDLNGKSEN